MVLCAICYCLLVFGALSGGISHTRTQWECGPNAPPTPYGKDLFPLSFTLDVGPSLALGIAAEVGRALKLAGGGEKGSAPALPPLLSQAGYRALPAFRPKDERTDP